jgi:WD40 repeat protein
VFVTGYSAYDYATVAYDAATGKQVWVERWNGPFGSYDSASALAVSPDGSTVFVTGSSDDPGNDGFFDYATVAYDAATGTQSWEMLYYDTSDAFATGLGVSPDGSTVFVTGYSRGSTGIGDYVTVAYHAATGNQAWATHYDGPAQGADVAKALGVSLDGSTVFVTGGSNGSKGHPDYATVAYDTATGTQVWAKRYGGRRPDTANALGVSPDGSTVFVTGQSKGSNRYDYATVAYDATTGTQMWVKRYDGPAHGDDSANALGVNPDGSTLFVTGGSAGSTGYDFATIAYSTA